MKIYEETCFPPSAPLAGWGSLTKTSLRNAMSHEVSDSHIIYDTRGEQACLRKLRPGTP